MTRKRLDWERDSCIALPPLIGPRQRGAPTLAVQPFEASIMRANIGVLGLPAVSEALACVS